MKRMFLKRFVSVIAIWTVLLNGCTSWRALETPLEVTTNPERAQVVLKNGQVVEVKGVHVLSDTLTGMGKRTETKGWREVEEYWDVPVLVAMSDIQEIKTRQTDGPRTIGFIAGTALVLGVVVIWAAYNPPLCGGDAGLQECW